MATRNSGKSVDLTTDWSEWIKDERGFWFKERLGPTGLQEFEYDYNPDASEDRQQQTSQTEQLSTPRKTWAIGDPQPLSSYGSPPLDTQPNPNFTTVPSTSPFSTTHYIANTNRTTFPNYSSSPTFQNPQEWRGDTTLSAQSPSRGNNLLGQSTELPVYDPQDNMTLALPRNPVASPPKDFYSTSPRQSLPKDTPSDLKSQNVLDSRYKVIPNHKLDKFFTIGRVFMTVWVEPLGESPGSKKFIRKNGGTMSAASQQAADSYLGVKGHFKIRRFVVITKNHGNVLCSPIHTYGGQACFKYGLPDVHKHTIIHTSEKAPYEQWYKNPEDGSIITEGLSKDPIRVVSEQSGPEGDLGVNSRLNLSKVYTIEFNVRVLNIGMVYSKHLEMLTHYASKARNEESRGPTHRPSKPLKDNHDTSKGGGPKEKKKKRT